MPMWPDEIPVPAGGSEVEPAAMHVNDRGAFPRRAGSPEAGDPSDGIGFEGHVRGPTTRSITSSNGARAAVPPSFTLNGCDGSAKSGRRGGICLAEAMNHSAMALSRSVSEHLSLHYRPSMTVAGTAIADNPARQPSR